MSLSDTGGHWQRHLVERSKMDLDALFCFFLESLECSMLFQRGSSLASMVVMALSCYFALDVKLGPTFISFRCSFQSSIPTPIKNFNRYLGVMSLASKPSLLIVIPFKESKL